MEKYQIEKLKDDALKELIQRVMSVDVKYVPNYSSCWDNYECPFCCNDGNVMFDIKHDESCLYQFAKEMRTKLEVLEKL